MQNYQKRKKMEEWVKVADLMTVASLEEKKMIQNEEAVMEMKERLAKAQVRARAYTSILLDDFHEEYQHQTLQHGKDHIKEEIDIRNRISQKTENIVPPCKKK